MIKGLNHSEEGVKTTHDDKEESVHQYSPNDSSNTETEGDERCDKKNGASGRGVTSIVRVRHCQTPDSNTQLPQKHFMGVLSTTPEFGNTIRGTERKD